MLVRLQLQEGAAKIVWVMNKAPTFDSVKVRHRSRGFVGLLQGCFGVSIPSTWADIKVCNDAETPFD